MTGARQAWLVLAASLAVSGGPGASAARQAPSDAAGPKQFLERIYAGYSKPVHSAVDYLSPPDDRRTFEPGLVRLIRRDQAKNAADPVDWLSEADLFCECQDFEDVRSRVTLESVGPDRAKASVTIADRGVKPARLRFVLVRTAAGWRIWDMVGSNGRSLRADLQADLARAPRAPKRGSPRRIEPPGGSARPIHDG